MKPGLETLEYEDLRAAIRNVSNSHIPQLHEVARVLKQMAKIASSEETSTPVVDFEEDEKNSMSPIHFLHFTSGGEI